MPRYSYKALNSRGKHVSGTKDAENPRALRHVLRREGFFVTSTSESDQRRGKKSRLVEINLLSFFDRIKLQHVAAFTRNLATLMGAGISITEALRTLADQSTSEKFGQLLITIRAAINEGSSLAAALEKESKVFPELYVNMVRAGEAAGNLDQVLVRLHALLENQMRLKRKVGASMVYPILMAIIGIGITAMLMIVIVPNMTMIFADMGKALPWNTRLLIFVADICGSYWELLILGLAGLFAGFMSWKRSPAGRVILDRFYLKIWIVGTLVRMVAISRFARALGTMLAAGVPLLQALDISRSIIGNRVLTKVVDNAREAICEGEPIAEPLAKSGHFPPMVTRMIAVGEQSGQLEKMLEAVADSYENEVEIQMQKLTALMEPLIILLMGCSVGFIVLSILMPILDMNELIG